MLFIGLAVLVIFIVLTILIVYNNRIAYDEILEVEAQVTDMYNVNDILDGNSVNFTEKDALYMPEVYCVTLTYKDYSQTFSNQKLYNSVIEGSFVHVLLYRGYNKHRELVWQELRLPD